MRHTTCFSTVQGITHVTWYIAIPAKNNFAQKFLQSSICYKSVKTINQINYHYERSLQ